MATPIAHVLRDLSGRYPLTMLGSWNERRVSPFRTLIGTILSARSRDEMTDVITERLFQRFGTPRALAHADRRAVERILQPIGFYRTKARYVMETARMVEEQGGKLPRTIEGLMEYPGVGRKVANCVLVYAFGQEAIPVDTHVHRVSNRMGWFRTRTPQETERRLVELVPKRLWPVINEALVAHGKAVCKPIGPTCDLCPIYRHCARVGVKPGKPSRAAPPDA
ncbi:MAG TPA: endonuclease III [Planctomycetota bacterium]|nr:endonuclease III [Planctomycetota bacterium]